jgi:hypothetical protein
MNVLYECDDETRWDEKRKEKRKEEKKEQTEEGGRTES